MKPNMNLNQDKVPIDLEEAVKLLKESFDETDINIIKDSFFNYDRLHFTLGMLIRNEWSMWDKNSILVKWFKKHYSLDHADDISGLILACATADIRGEPRKDKELAKRFFDHWK